MLLWDRDLGRVSAGQPSALAVIADASEERAASLAVISNNKLKVPIAVFATTSLTHDVNKCRSTEAKPGSMIMLSLLELSKIDLKLAMLASACFHDYVHIKAPPASLGQGIQKY